MEKLIEILKKKERKKNIQKGNVPTVFITDSQSKRGLSSM